MNRRFLRVLMLAAVSVGLVAHTAPVFAEAKTGYLKNNIHYQEKPARGGQMVYRASYANYVDPGEGHRFLPVNAKVTVDVTRGWRGRRLTITHLASNKTIDFEYNERNMGISMDEYMDLIVSPKKVSMSGLNQVDRKGIKQGKIYTGMTRKGVRMALGYPAKHRTPDLQYPSYTYWRDRWRTMAVEFNSKGVVQRIR